MIYLIFLKKYIGCCGGNMKKEKIFRHDQLEREQTLLCFKSKEELVRMITLLEEQIDIKDRYCGLIRDISFDYDELNKVDDLQALIDQLFTWAGCSIRNDIETVVYENSNGKYNIMGDKLK